MQIGLISDCEGNVGALEAALAAIKQHAPDLVVGAGDILACPFSPTLQVRRSRCFEPRPLRQFLATTTATSLTGARAGGRTRCGCDFGAPIPRVSWINDVGAGQALIAPSDLAWLRGLPEEFLVTEGVWVCHRMPGNPWNSIWPRSPAYDANVSDADRDASLQMLATVDAELVLCGHVPTPSEYDRLPDGRELRVIRAGERTNESVGYAMLTRSTAGWVVEWCTADIGRQVP